MLQNISWTEFLLVLVGLLGLYYLLLVVMFSKDILRRKARPPDKVKRVWKPEDQATPVEETIADDDHFDEQSDTADDAAPEEEKAFHSLELLARDIEEIVSSAGEGYQKETLMSRLQQEISRYPMLNRLAFRIAVNNLIIKHAQQYCQIAISKEEAEQLWAPTQN